MLKENLREVEKNIQEACDRAKRAREEVTLIAVSKTKPLEDIEEILEEDVIDFGENKVQELCDKYEKISRPVNWHLIGHLQTNKVKYIVDKAALIHSVDSYKLAEQINKEAKKKNVVVPILLQVNIAKEDTKFGLEREEVLPLIEKIKDMDAIQIRGLMTIAPFVENPEENRVHFKNLYQLYIDIREKSINNVIMDTLSMGMTGDYQVAIEEGATMIRVGTGIFGERNYKI